MQIHFIAYHFNLHVLNPIQAGGEGGGVETTRGISFFLLLQNQSSDWAEISWLFPTFSWDYENQLYF